MPILTRAEYSVGDLLVRYVAAEDRPDAWGLMLLPRAKASEAVAPREWLDSPAITQLPAPWNRSRAWEVDPLVHAHVGGDVLPGGFANGRTLRNSGTTASFAVREHRRVDAADGLVVLTTVLEAACGLVCFHELTIDPRTGVASVRVIAENPTPQPLTLDYLSAFSLGGLTPFASDDASGRLHVHRFRSAWSAEGRHEERSLEALHLERSWTGHGMRSERFGQAGSLPVNGWFPFVALEDRGAGVTWAAQLATPGTWNLEIYRRADQVALSGGGADRLDGEWRHTLAPGGRVAASEAFLTVAVGGVEEACDRLLSAARARTTLPAGESDLPIVFNEWCTSWGHPTHDSLVALADRLAGIGVRYLVIDDGWAERPGDQFQQNGDWRVNRRAFPGGLRATTEAIRARGLVPGLWFEFEAINPGSAAWHETAHQLHRDGAPLQVGPRRFWDFRDPWVHDFLAERVIARLSDDGFGYLKVDCNDSVGPGVDGPLSPGENLREHLAGVQRFFVRLRRELPELVIENCSSGGHRLEPSMMALTAMSSFSDAHETPDIPLIAANLNPLVPSAQKQIWAVLRASDTAERLSYSLAATFLGRMCLSGDVAALAPAAWRQVTDAIAFYRAVAPLIRDGVFRCHRMSEGSLAHPRGAQIVTITAHDGRSLLVVWHAFGGSIAALQLALPTATAWRVEKACAQPEPAFSIDQGVLHWRPAGEWTGGVILLGRG
jgi:alpha-galactosidase